MTQMVFIESAQKEMLISHLYKIPTFSNSFLTM